MPMPARTDRLTLAALSALLHAPQPLADGGLDAWREFGVRYRQWYESQRNPLVGELEEALAPDEEHEETTH